jgi:2-C-methyl-D-erythritol 2,4-cyclodiphosphate synthase
MELRIGQGIDRHPLVPGRRLRLGGIDIEHDRGLAGHSDADAVLHALCDALLGAAALGDLGSHFSDADPAQRDRDSAEFLCEILGKVRHSGLELVNADLTVMAEAPRLAPHIDAMRRRLAEICGVGTERISVKATRGEGLGPEGRAECIAVWAVVLLRGGREGS